MIKCREEEYLSEHETKVCDIMFALFDQEEVMRAYSHELKAEGEAIGEARSRAEGAEIEKVSAINNLIGKLFKMDMARKKAAAIEIGMQNSGLAATLARKVMTICIDSRP